MEGTVMLFSVARQVGPAMREKRESAAACCFSGVGDGRRRGEEWRREREGSHWRLISGLAATGAFR
ncbi:hypothetical protein HAX54_010137, partial [Datura stramonium]|nr:hypothetical protein [Datura stramonium]